MLKKEAEELLEMLGEDNYGYGEKATYTYILKVSIKQGKILQCDFLAVNVSLLRSDCKHFLSNRKDIPKLINKTEKEKIDKAFDLTALERAIEKSTGKADSLEDKDIIIKTYEQFLQVLEEYNVLKEYYKELEQLETEKKLLNKDNLVEVKFKRYHSSETGGNFLILDEEVSKSIFSKLMKAGMNYHMYDSDNEERFKGYYFEAGEETEIELAKQGIKIK